MILRFDSVGGASGDMVLGALADLGADLGAIATQLRTAIPDHFHLRIDRVVEAGLRGTRVSVDVHDHDAPEDHGHGHSRGHGHGHGHEHHHGDDAHGHEPAHAHGHEHAHGHGHEADRRAPRPAERHDAHEHAQFRNLPAILDILRRSPQVPRAAELAAATFRRLAEAEAAVHGTTPDQVHFHEVGAVDAIVDILGSCLALEQLGVAAVSVGPLPEGQGTLTCAHGVMPIPAPATAELLRGHPVVRVDEPFELVTPTGAALLMTWKSLLPASGAYAAVRHGVGFGQRALTSRPNLLRATLAEAVSEAAAATAGDQVVLLEANLDDCPGEWLGAAMEKLLAADALDVWFAPIQMKKHRPGVLLSVLCEPGRAEALKGVVFTETTTFGIRESMRSRTVLARRVVLAETPYGPVRVKIGSRNGIDTIAQPEFEDCRRAAERHGVAVRAVFAAAQAAAKP